MKKSFFLSFIFIFILNGCFSVKKINETVNPFAKFSTKEEIEAPNKAPSWIKEKKLDKHIVSIGATKSIEGNRKDNIDFLIKKALISAKNNQLKKVYSRTIFLYRNYLEKINNQRVFNKDIKGMAEHIALKAITKAKVKKHWISPNQELFILLAVKSDTVANYIQEGSKKLFKKDEKLYQEFLSNLAKEEIVKFLEK